MLTSLKPCKHETDEPCSYNKLRKEDPKDIAKRLSKFVDERAANANEEDMNDAEEFWVDFEGLLLDTHPHFKARIVRIARDMRVEPEIEMIPIFVQKYLKYLEKMHISLIKSEGMLKNAMAEVDIHLHRKTIRLILEEIQAMIDAGVAPTITETKKLDRQLEKFVRKNPRQRKLSILEKRYIGTFGEFYSYLDALVDEER